MRLIMIDAIILGILFISVLIGWFRGAVKEVCSILSWVGSGYLAYKLFPLGLEIVREHISQPLLANLVTGISLFVLFLIVLSLLTYLFSSIVRGSVFSIADKLSGALFGIVRGLLVISIAEFGMTYYIFKEPPAMFSTSKLLPHAKQISQMLFLLLPENIQSELIKHLNNDKKQDLIKDFGGKINNNILAQPENSSQNQFNDQATSSPLEAGNKAIDLAHLGVKKSNPNPNINKSVRSDLDKLIDQHI